jgi:hypothetical protein
MKSRSARILPLFLCAGLVIALGGEKKGGTRYEYVQVDRFNVAEDVVDFPADYQIGIMEDLIKALQRTKNLTGVLREGETLPEGKQVLHLTGTVTKFKKGSQAARYLVGFGAGATVVVAQVRFYDATTKQLLLERKADGKVWIGVMGGKSAGATNGLAKEIVKVVKANFL